MEWLPVEGVASNATIRRKVLVLVCLCSKALLMCEKIKFLFCSLEDPIDRSIDRSKEPSVGLIMLGDGETRARSLVLKFLYKFAANICTASICTETRVTGDYCVA